MEHLSQKQSIMITAFKAASGMDTYRDTCAMKVIHITKRIAGE